MLEVLFAQQVVLLNPKQDSMGNRCPFGDLVEA
jgi:hypothetical protein